MSRIPALAAVRALAAGLVLLSHVGYWTGATATGFLGGLAARGDVGVALFFALSAFLLLRPWLTATAPNTRTYAVRRAARILPAYWIVLVGVLLVAAANPRFTGGTGGAGTIITHLFVAQGWGGRSYQAFSQTWSLTTEVTFYFLVPVVGLALARLRPELLPRLVLAAAGTGLVATGVATAWVTADPDGHGGVLGSSALGHAAWFAAGLGVAAYRVRGGTTTTRLPGRVVRMLADNPGTALACAGALALLASTPLAGPRLLSETTVVAAVTKEALYAAIAGLVLLAATASTSTSRVLRALSERPATTFAGDISYGVFLSHVLALQVAFLLTGWRLFEAPFGPVLTSVLVLTVGFSIVLFYAVEKPISRLVHRG